MSVKTVVRAAAGANKTPPPATGSGDGVGVGVGAGVGVGVGVGILGASGEIVPGNFQGVFVKAFFGAGLCGTTITIFGKVSLPNPNGSFIRIGLLEANW